MKRFISSEGVLRLWHGSNQPVLKPDRSMCTHNGDFGKYIFYTGDREDIALDRAQAKSLNGYRGKPVVTQYTCDTKGLTILQFEKADVDWILAIADGREGISPPEADIVIGPIADGKDINNALLRFSFIRNVREAKLNIFERGRYSNGYKELLNAELTNSLPSNDEMPFAYYHELFLRNNVFEAYCSFLGDNVSGREMEKLFTDAGIYDYLFRHCRKYKKKDPYETAFVIADKFRKKIPEHLMIKRPEVMPVNDFEW